MKLSMQGTKTWYSVKLSNNGSSQFSEADFSARVDDIVEGFSENPKDMVINFTEVGFLPTICIRQFERLVKEIRGKGCHVAFLNLPESIHAILSSGERSRSRKFISEKEAVRFVTQKMKKKESTNPFLVCLHA